MIRSLAAASAQVSLLWVAAVLSAGPLAAQPKSDPDWPCPQRRTPEIDLAQVWSGPDPASAGLPRLVILILWGNPPMVGATGFEPATP